MNELTVLLEQTQLEKTKAQKVLDSFTDFFSQASEWEKKTKELVITDATQVAEMEMARTGRLQLKTLRVSAEKTKKRLKENIVIEGKFIDSIYNTVVAVIKPLEDDLLAKEKFVENQIKEAQEQKIRDRKAMLEPYEVDVSCYDFSLMPDTIFDKLLADSKELYERRKEDERKAEEERIEKEKAEKEEQEQIRKENEELRKKNEAAEKKLKAEKEKKEKERKAKEKEAAEKKAKEETERKAALAPDKEKLRSDLDDLLFVDEPEVKDREIAKVLEYARSAIVTARQQIEEIN